MNASKQPLRAPTLTNHPVDVGHRTEGAILYYLVGAGFSVLVPVGVNQRYDLVIDLEGEFVRAQCKTGRLRGGMIEFNTRSVVTSKTRNVTRGYNGEVEVFLVKCPETEPIYCIPVEAAPRDIMHLRLDPCRNGQHQRVHWARDYELPA